MSQIERGKAPTSEGYILAENILHRRGEVARRMESTGADLRKEYLSRTYHPSLEAGANHTEEVLPVNIFIRRDGKTPHINHSYRVALAVQDVLLQQRGIDPFKVTHPITDLTNLELIILNAAITHDNIEEPQEYLIEGKNGGLTPAQVKTNYKKHMDKYDPQLTLSIWNAMNVYNRFWPNNVKKTEQLYFDGITQAAFLAHYNWIIKTKDAQDSPEGDLANLTHIIEASQHVSPAIFDKLNKPRAKLERTLPYVRQFTPQAIYSSFLATQEALIHFPKLAVSTYPEKFLLPTTKKEEIPLFTPHEPA